MRRGRRCGARYVGAVRRRRAGAVCARCGRRHRRIFGALEEGEAVKLRALEQILVQRVKKRNTRSLG